MPDTKLQATLDGYKAEVNKSLEQIFNEVPALLGWELSGHSRKALEMLREFSLRPGKRFRGTMASFAYDNASGGKYGQSGLRAAAAVELLQSYLLIVDDVMDQSGLRRGLPTIHRLYSEEDFVPGGHLPNMKAVNVGLIAQHLAGMVIGTIKETPDRVADASYLFQKNVAATVFGQLEDLYHHSRTGAISEADILQMYKLKSSYYTFVNPLQVGLILGGIKDQETLDEAERFGISAGIAFQLSDDLLGIFGNPEKTGKGNLDDISEGKYTVLVHKALNGISGDDLDYLRSLLGSVGLEEPDLSRVRNILQGCGARGYVEKLASEYANEAKTIIEASSFWKRGAKDFINGLVDYSIKRSQ